MWGNEALGERLSVYQTFYNENNRLNIFTIVTKLNIKIKYVPKC